METLAKNYLQGCIKEFKGLKELGEKTFSQDKEEKIKLCGSNIN